MDIIYRAFNNNDYISCEELVNEAWGFDRLFESESLRTIAKYLYTEGSLVSSNYRHVAVYQETVIGFLFGYNCRLNKNILSALRLGLKATIDLNFKKMNDKEKKKFIAVIKEHQTNRSEVVSKNANEIVLFVVSPKFQGHGIGTRLWLGFREFCSLSINSSIQVETNKAGAGSYYERLGFHHLADFESPLHNLATVGGQACIYEYTQEKS